jgi:predicted nucleic acid-binding protein
MLLDTCILVDVLRGKSAALAFITGLKTPPQISAVTLTQLVAGCRNVKERRQIDSLLSHYSVHDIGRDIANLAGEYIRSYGASHGTDPIDALIAATAKVQGVPLATLNLKHFPMFEGLARPYRA